MGTAGLTLRAPKPISESQSNQLDILCRAKAEISLGFAARLRVTEQNDISRKHGLGRTSPACSKYGSCQWEGFAWCPPRRYPNPNPEHLEIPGQMASFLKWKSKQYFNAGDCSENWQSRMAPGLFEENQAEVDSSSLISCMHINSCCAWQVVKSEICFSTHHTIKYVTAQ